MVSFGFSFNRFARHKGLRSDRKKNKLSRKQDLLTYNLKLSHLKTERRGYPYWYEWPRWLSLRSYKWRRR